MSFTPNTTELGTIEEGLLNTLRVRYPDVYTPTREFVQSVAMHSHAARTLIKINPGSYGVRAPEPGDKVLIAPVIMGNKIYEVATYVKGGKDDMGAAVACVAFSTGIIKLVGALRLTVIS